jgi:pyruvate dehydrogenase E1 component
VAADVWSVTSYKQLYREAHEAEHWNLLHPGKKRKIPYVEKCLGQEPGVFVAASDYVKALPDTIARWLPRPLTSLGTDGFGRSDTRQALRSFFEVDSRFITLAVLAALAREGEMDSKVVRQAMKTMEIDPDKANPMNV